MSYELRPSEIGLNDHASGKPSRDDEQVASSKTASDEVDQFVDAELVPDPPSPFVFGMKALLGLMGIAAFQFALMSYLGPMIGLMVGIALCVLAMGVLMVSSIVMGLRPGSGMMEQMDRIAIRLVVGIVVLLFGTIIAGGGQMVYMVLEEARFSWELQSDLGFSYTERTLFDPDTARAYNVLEITKVTTGGAFDQAGLQKGDLIVLENTRDELLSTFAEQRGQSIDVAVANYEAVTGNIDEATERSVTINIPP